MKLCLYNFRQAMDGLLRYDWSYATSLLTPKSLPYPPYVQEEWSPFWKSSPTYTVELDCKNSKEIISGVVYRATPFGAAICEEFSQSTPVNIATGAQPLSSSEASVTLRPESDFSNTRAARPTLYQTLSDTPFYWKIN